MTNLDSCHTYEHAATFKTTVLSGGRYMHFSGGCDRDYRGIPICNTCRNNERGSNLSS
jgi:hypothetical protein